MPRTQSLTDRQVERLARASRERRMKWWREARFGMFIHWGLYSQLGRGEWVMNRDCIPVQEYEKLSWSFKPKAGAARQWARLAQDAGMKYMVLTAKHHEGFCLWDTRQTDYNAARRGPGRDLVAEYVQACREYGLKVGLYYSLMDWRHPDGVRCQTDLRARRRFLDFTQACVRELMSNYGKIDLLFYDVSWPLKGARQWESLRMNAMVRRLQPHILINDRAGLPEDFGTPEGEVKAIKDRAWTACMTLNDGEWGYGDRVEEDWSSVRDILRMLRTATAGGGEGNLLLNIGPKADGSVDPKAVRRLTAVGRWLKVHGQAVYGPMEKTAGRLEVWASCGFYTLKGNSAYLWNLRGYPGREMILGGFQTKVRRVTCLATGKAFAFTQTAMQLHVTGLPTHNPDRIAGTPVFRIDFDGRPRQAIGMSCTGKRKCLQ